MFEVKFNENIDIEKNITTSKNNVKRFTYLKALKVGIISLVTLSLLGLTLSSTELSITVAMILCTSTTITAGYTMVEMFSEIINKIKDNNSRNNLKKVVDKLENNEICTNTNELVNSVIFKSEEKVVVEKKSDNVKCNCEQEVVDKYYLFLDNSSQLQGVLERNNYKTVNNQKSSCTNYYILEESDIKEFESKVTKVKKLVRTKDDV